MLGCKPSRVSVDGDVIVDGVKLGFVEVELIPEGPMKAFLASGVEFSQGRPPASSSVKTDLDGSFSLKVVPGPYAVFARAKEHTWLFWQTVEASGAQPRLLLNDENLSDSGCAQCIPIAGDEKAEKVPPPRVPPAVMVMGEAPPAAMVSMGSLDRSLIHKVVRANRGQVRWCHEYQLQEFPSLQGRVTVKFVIAPTGTVATSTVAQSTVNNSALEACLAGRVRTWKFPKPKGGGVVIVTYPFDFARK